MIEPIELRIEKLVKEQFDKMTFSKRESNKARLVNICQSIVVNEWNFSNQKTWDLIDKNVDNLISDELD